MVLWAIGRGLNPRTEHIGLRMSVQSRHFFSTPEIDGPGTAERAPPLHHDEKEHGPVIKIQW